MKSITFFLKLPEDQFLPVGSFSGNTGDFMKKVPTATCTLRDRYIVFIE